VTWLAGWLADQLVAVSAKRLVVVSADPWADLLDSELAAEWVDWLVGL
jgi:hypothetical protein